MRDRRHKRGIRGFVRARSGNAGTEFAMIAPFLLLLLIGSIEIGRGLRDYHVVNESVRDAARFLSRANVTDCPGSTYVNAGDSLIAQALAITGNTDTATPAPDLLGYWNFPGDAASVQTTITCVPKGTALTGGIYADATTEVPVIEVVATVPFTFLFGEFAVPDGTITFTLAHTVVNVSQGIFP